VNGLAGDVARGFANAVGNSDKRSRELDVGRGVITVVNATSWTSGLCLRGVARLGVGHPMNAYWHRQSSSKLDECVDRT
jgi:hypothetical protein